jgi:hypothetical protein
MGLDDPPAGRSVSGPVLEAQPFVVGHCRRQHGELLGIDGRGVLRRQWDGRGVQRADAVPQPGRQYLFELGERTDGCLLDAVDGLDGRCTQADGDGHGFVVVEQQRGHRLARDQPIAADRAHRRLYRIAEVAQPLDVATDRPQADLQALGELAARPFARGLQQGQQGQQPAGSSTHASSMPAMCDRNCPIWALASGSWMRKG